VSWLDRLLSREGPYQSRRIEAIDCDDTRVELEGEVEALELLHDPVEGEPAVVLNYRAQRPGVAQRYFGIHEAAGEIEGYQATNFVLRDESGAALIEVERGGDLAKLHRRLRDEFGVDLQVEVDHIAPGDRVRLRGRVRARTEEGSPHRREPWAVVVSLDELEHRPG
jgi:hypothetical protein